MAQKTKRLYMILTAKKYRQSLTGYVKLAKHLFERPNKITIVIHCADQEPMSTIQKITSCQSIHSL